MKCILYDVESVYSYMNWINIIIFFLSWLDYDALEIQDSAFCIWRPRTAVWEEAIERMRVEGSPRARRKCSHIEPALFLNIHIW